MITLGNIYEQSHEPEALGISKALSKESTSSAIFLLDFLHPLVIKLSKCLQTEKLHLSITSSLVHATLHTIDQGSGTYGSRARCGSFDDCIWLSQIKLEFEKLQILIPPVTWRRRDASRNKSRPMTLRTFRVYKPVRRPARLTVYHASVGSTYPSLSFAQN